MNAYRQSSQRAMQTSERAELFQYKRKVLDLENRVRQQRSENSEAALAREAAETQAAQIYESHKQESERYIHELAVKDEETTRLALSLSESRKNADGLHAELMQTATELARLRQNVSIGPQQDSLLARARIENQQLEDETQLLRQENSNQRAAIATLESEVARLGKALAENANASGMNPAEQQQLSEALATRRALEDTNKQLRLRLEIAKVNEHMNLVLNEEKRSLSKRLEALEGVETKNQSLEFRLEVLERERSQWEAYLASEPTFKFPAQAAMAFAELRKENESLKAQLTRSAKRSEEVRRLSVPLPIQSQASELESLRRQLETEISARDHLEVQNKVKDEQIRYLEERFQSGNLSKSSKDLQRTNDKLSGELGRLQAALDARNREFNALMNDQYKSIDEVKSKAAQDIQKIQEKNDSLQHEVESASAFTDTLKAQLVDALEQLNHAEKRNVTPGFAVLEVTGSTYDHEVGDRLERLALLEHENADLRAQVDLQPVKTVPFSTLSVVSNQVDKLRADLERKAKIEQRALDAFRLRSAEQYAARYDLFGYDLEVKPNRTCLVRSAYTLSDDLGIFEFIFDSIKREYTDMSYTSSVRAYQNHYEYWIKQMKCPPGFLATVFLENFEKYGPPPHRKQNVDRGY